MKFKFKLQPFTKYGRIQEEKASTLLRIQLIAEWCHIFTVAATVWRRRRFVCIESAYLVYYDACDICMHVYFCSPTGIASSSLFIRIVLLYVDTELKSGRYIPSYEENWFYMRFLTRLFGVRGKYNDTKEDAQLQLILLCL